MALYGFAVFISAFLLFQIQPLLGKFILPWFGGTPTVWTSCLLSFQLLLPAGYAYAYLSTKWLSTRVQVAVHTVLLLSALALPIAPSASWGLSISGEPTLRICQLVTTCLGLPFIVLAATAPLLQHWFTLTRPGKSPFRLYALSNAGSQIALLSYPTFVETHLGRATQVAFWRGGLGLFAMSCVWAGLKVWKRSAVTPTPIARGTVPRPPWGHKALWLLLPACGSLLLTATTNKLCQDVAPMALLWVMPLSVYLLSFVLCFNGSGIYDRRFFGPLLLAALATAAMLIAGAFTFSTVPQVLVLLGGLFACCMVCHGELYRLRPHPSDLTLFYLLISVGGALGGIFVALIAPRVFKDYFELQWGLILCGALFLTICWREQRDRSGRSWIRLTLATGTVGLAALAFFLERSSHENDRLLVFQTRNFYGVLKVYRHESTNPSENLMELVHGRIAHGVQFLEPARAATPTLYYTKSSGVGKAFELLARETHRRIGVVGLGVGTIAAYARPGDQFTFYEINPEVKKVADADFTFLKNCAGGVNVVLGDARLSLENQPNQNFNLLVLDAFNSDSIPFHLLTREAFEVYQRHVITNGIIAIHVSNMSLNLEPVVLNLAHQFGYIPQAVEQPQTDEARGLLPSTWILLSRSSNSPNFTELTAAVHQSAPVGFNVPLWTDDRNALFPILRFWNKATSDTRATYQSEPTRSHAKGTQVSTTIERFREAVAADPNSSIALNNLACLLATASDPALRNGAEAVALAEKACSLTHYENTSTLSTLAAAYAEAGRFDEAIATSEKACAMAAEKGENSMLAGNRQMLKCFREKRPFHQQNL